MHSVFRLEFDNLPRVLAPTTLTSILQAPCFYIPCDRLSLCHESSFSKWCSRILTISYRMLLLHTITYGHRILSVSLGKIINPTLAFSLVTVNLGSGAPIDSWQILLLYGEKREYGKNNTLRLTIGYLSSLVCQMRSTYIVDSWIS